MTPDPCTTIRALAARRAAHAETLIKAGKLTRAQADQDASLWARLDQFFAERAKSTIGLGGMARSHWPSAARSTLAAASAAIRDHQAGGDGAHVWPLICLARNTAIAAEIWGKVIDAGTNYHAAMHICFAGSDEQEQAA